MQSRLFVYCFNQEVNSVVFVYSVDEARGVVGSPLIADVDESPLYSSSTARGLSLL